MVWLDHILVNHSPVEGYLGFSQFWVIVNKVAVNTYVHLKTIFCDLHVCPSPIPHRPDDESCLVSAL